MGNNTYYWDQATGVSVEGSTYTADYSIESVISATNMWQPTAIQDFDLASIILVTAVLLIITIVFIVAIIRYLKRKLTRNSSAD
jgi:heme/copper-type cytochrome/quinol oxidase subunit 2